MSGPPFSSIADLLTLEPQGPDVWVGANDEYPWVRVYGGQVVAQAVWAAAQTVPEEHQIHSVHAYFIRGGDGSEPVRYEVDRIRNGRSFMTRRVVARQSGGAILNLAASFHVEEEAPDVMGIAPMPDVPGPDELEPMEWGPLLQRRPVPDSGDGHARVWLRVKGPIDDDRLMQAAALLYASDDAALEAMQLSHPLGQWTDSEGEDKYMGASLDHAVWLHRAGRADEWMLHDMASIGVYSSRGLAIGQIWGADGTHVATIAQEGLLREMRKQ